MPSQSDSQTDLALSLLSESGPSTETRSDPSLESSADLLSALDELRGLWLSGHQRGCLCHSCPELRRLVLNSCYWAECYGDVWSPQDETAYANAVAI